MLDNEDISKKENNTEKTAEMKQEQINQEETMKEKPSESENKNEENSNGNNGRWDTSEHLRFLQGCLLFKNNWKKVETYVRTRTSTQIRSHAQKYLKKLEKKYYSNGLGNISPNDSFNDDFIDYNLNKKETKDNNNININEEIKEIKENENLINSKEINDNIKEINNINNKTPSMKLKEFNEGDNKFKLTEEKTKKLVEDLNKKNYDIEFVEKVIINIFRPNKKCEEIKSETKKSASKISNTHNKTSKNIFLCQKQKREVNYESKIKESLDSNNQIDLEHLLKIYKQRCSPEYDILLYLIENN